MARDTQQTRGKGVSLAPGPGRDPGPDRNRLRPERGDFRGSWGMGEPVMSQRTTGEREARSRRLARRDPKPDRETVSADRHARWLQDAEPQYRLPSVGAQKTDNPKSR